MYLTLRHMLILYSEPCDGSPTKDEVTYLELFEFGSSRKITAAQTIQNAIIYVMELYKSWTFIVWISRQRHSTSARLQSKSNLSYYYHDISYQSLPIVAGQNYCVATTF